MTRSFTALFFIIFLCAFSYLKLKGISHYSDDVWFSNQAHTPDIFQWLVIRYQTWSSRTPIEFALLKIINHKQTWAFLNAFFIAITVCSFSAIVAKNKKEVILSSLTFLLIILFTIKKGFINEGILWMTGSVNYLWPFALAILGFALLKRCTTEQHLYRNALFTAIIFFLSSFSEQLVVINLFLLPTIALLYRGPVQKMALLSLATTLLALTYIILSPGNANRLHLEIGRWMPDFVNLNFVDKVLMGLNLAFDQMFTVQPIAVGIIYLCLALILRNNKKAQIFSLLLLIATIILSLIERRVFATSNFDAIYKFSSENITSTFAIARAATVIIFALATTLLVFLAQQERKAAWLIAIAYIVSYSGTVMLGLSPTIYASEQRVLMVSGMMVSALAAYLALQACAMRRSKLLR
ncbi:DUF6056 family protein [Pantoea cypripedii]|uniref:Uncharacterized protein n=1 Tax=Pantoea cypripedii TaxID=55209 RepID=A0A1X1EUY7_PANCY|nr:DUF6056 family protein [Pantoea cypripedii]MBP2197848.1 putative membrane protein [Pantoea cypripedii]ORM93713.1 hypothetical protein HA50_10290 [Pantoea cypripedii]